MQIRAVPVHRSLEAKMCDVDVLSSRDVPLGGPRGIVVRRTLPQRARTFVGAWCFIDHYGPHDSRDGGGMRLPAHPHTGLQTVSWLFSGEIEHRDSHGVHKLVRPGELCLMSSGHGICHSEMSTADTEILHGVQMWIALPEGARHGPRNFHHHVPEMVCRDGVQFLVFLGSLVGTTSPVQTATPLLGAQITLAVGAHCTLAVDQGFEYAILVDTGEIRADDHPVHPTQLYVRSIGADQMHLANDGDRPARVMLLGGPPFPEPIVMWWNFVGRSHDEIVAYREAWQQEADQFGSVLGYEGSPSRLPAPPLPNGKLRPRGNRTTSL